MPIDPAEPRYLEPLLRDVARLAHRDGVGVVLLGSVATPKYTEPLLDVLGSRLLSSRVLRAAHTIDTQRCRR